MGMVGPDEPRYAAISRAMTDSGDWITPRLWGQPWFEKPALLYWMMAAAFRVGLGPDLAPRLPVALLGLAFLVFFWWRLRIEWDARVASYATAMLATTAGWLTYSHVAVTDLPLAAFFSASVLMAMPWAAHEKRREGLTAAAACLGLAALAKGLVPLILFLPVLAFGWRRLGDWFRPGPILALAILAGPWYVLCTIRNGNEFLSVFFVQQHFQRFTSEGLQHVQPVWFYVPVFLLLLYPWFPVLAIPWGGLSVWLRDRRALVLGATVIFGFVFFSISINKLPGYLLPLLPLACVLIAFKLARTPHPETAVVAPITLLGALPVIGMVAAEALAFGLRNAQIQWSAGAILLAIAGGAGVLVAIAMRGRAVETAGVLVGLGLLWFQFAFFPLFDVAASARPLWIRDRPQCASNLPRGLLYGLNYYAQRRLPECSVGAGVEPGTGR
jgi:4-amino-4-deoxy-L-arabinose transferase-like glycosyltransferase